MPLRILFADDSLTAQNMGRKILTEAGYEVIAVSNGAAAVKKIAELKPDIIILDVYMPGYTGLEVCEKVRGSIDTLKTPVLLTVGTLEPWKPEEAHRVRADGVIVKPFEASDLLTVVKKFEDRIAQEAAAPPMIARSMPVERIDEFPESTHPQPVVTATVPTSTVEVPDHMATSSAFSDLLGSDPSHDMSGFHSHTNDNNAAHEVAPRSAAASAAIPDYELPVSWRKDVDPIAPSTASPVERVAAPDKPVEETRAPLPPPAPLRPLQIPVYQDSDGAGEASAAATAAEIVPTAGGPIGDVDIRREPHLEPTDAETTRNTIVESREPGLLPTTHSEVEEIFRAVEMEPVAPPPPPPPAVNEVKPHLVEPASDELPPGPRLVSRPPAVTDPVETKISETDFEARVAAAMAAYNQASAGREANRTAAETATAEIVEPTSKPASAPPSTQASESNNSLATTVAVPEPSPSKELPVNNQHDLTPSVPVATNPVAIRPDTASEGDITRSLTAEVAHAAIAASADAEITDHATIAQAVHRVMERLKPELVEEIMKELKSKK